MVLTRISRRTICSNLSHLKARSSGFQYGKSAQSGFSLFEILVTVGLIAFLMAILVPRLAPRTDSPLKKTARHLLVLGPDIRNSARLKNRTFRLVFDMTGDHHTFWVESAPGVVPAKTALRLEEESKLSEDERPAEVFQKEGKYTKDAFELPKDLFFAKIETPSFPEGASSGQAFLYFSPEGLVEPAAIQLTNGKETTWTLIVNPLTGRMDLVDRAISLRDLKE